MRIGSPLPAGRPAVSIQVVHSNSEGTIYVQGSEVHVVATLKVISGTNAGHWYEVTGDEAVIGRYPFCDIVLPSHSVSRQHARIMRESDGYYIEDLNSLNGTFVNGQRVGVRMRLRDQDQIHVYETVLSFHDGSNVEIGPTVAGNRTPPGIAVRPMHEPQSPAREMHIVGAMDALAEPRLDVGAEAKLRAVLEITRHLGRSSAVDEFLPKILDSLFEIFPQAERLHPAGGQSRRPVVPEGRQAAAGREWQFADIRAYQPFGGPACHDGWRGNSQQHGQFGCRGKCPRRCRYPFANVRTAYRPLRSSAGNHSYRHGRREPPFFRVGLGCVGERRHRGRSGGRTCPHL